MMNLHKRYETRELAQRYRRGTLTDNAALLVALNRPRGRHERAWERICDWLGMPAEEVADTSFPRPKIY